VRRNGDRAEQYERTGCATPPFELRLLYEMGFTSEGRSSSSTEPIWIGLEAPRSGVGGLYLGPLSCTLAYFAEIHKTMWEDVSVRFRDSYVSVAPIFSVFT
jgi:hypothetical protein